MKDYLFGFLSGILATFGMFLWIGNIRFIGLGLIIFAWLLGVGVYFHYKYNT